MTEQLNGELFASQSSVGQGPGARLRQDREEKHIRLEEMAKQMRFTPQRLIQLENDDYRTMGSRTFAYGYLRNYGRLLGKSEAEIAELLKLFDAQNFQDKIRHNKPQLIHEKIVHASPKATRRLGYLVVIIALVFIGFWWHSHSSSEAKIAEGKPGVSEANNNSTIPEQQVTAGVSSTADKANLQTLTAGPQPTSAAPPSAVVAPGQQTTTPVAAAPTQAPTPPVANTNAATDASKTTARSGSNEVRAKLIRE